MKNYLKQWPLIFAAVLLFGCDTSTKCLVQIGTETLTQWPVEEEDACAVLIFPVKNTSLPSKQSLLYYSTLQYLYVSSDVVDKIFDCLSEREILEARAFKFVTGSGSMKKFIMPVTLSNISSIFDVGESDVIMKNPYTGHNISLINVDYVKFKDSPLIRVPIP